MGIFLHEIPDCGERPVSWDSALWFGAGFGLVLLIALAWDLFDYERVKRAEKRKRRMRTDWARILEKRE